METVREEQSHWLGRLFHSWVAPLIRTGRRRPLTLEDLHDTPPPEDALENTSTRFRSHFQGHLLVALFQTFRERFIKIFLLLGIMTLLGLLRPLLLRELIGRFGRKSGTPYEDFFTFIDAEVALAFFAVGCFALLAFVRSHFLRHSFKMTWAMPGLLRHEAYHKLLQLSPRQKQRLTTGEFVNIATRDCDSTSMLAFLLEPLFYPITLLAYCGMLVYFLGPWALLAVLALAALIPIGRRLERRMSGLAQAVREQSKLRLGMLSEILSGIRVIKFHAWEERFAQRVLQVREREVELMRQRARVAARHSALTSLLPILTGASIVSLVAWISGVPSTADVFASFSVITSLVAIFSEAPDLIQSVSELKVSMKRLSDFLSQPEEPSPQNTQSASAITLANAQYSRISHSTDEPTNVALHDLTLSFPAGSCVCLVGAVGSGKSTLMSALLGELPLTAGRHQLVHPVAFAPQIAWNQNATVKDNIVFELPWNAQLFDEVIHASALQTDIQNWAGGIDSEVGERGLNLSGGQKQRLALARTLYAAKLQDIQTVIWDDPFSALDETVANHIFKNAIEQMLARKTRIFSTHRIDFALRADHVVVLDAGRIVEQGHPKELLTLNGHFARLVELHHQTRGHQLQHDSAQNESVQQTSEVPASTPGRLITDEKITLPIFNKDALKLYIRTLAPVLGLSGVVMIFLLPRLAEVGSNVWLGHWTSHPTTIALAQAMVIFGMLTFVTVITERGRTLILFEGGVKAGTTFFQNLMKGVFNAPLRFFDTSPQGRVLNRFTSDTTTIDSSMPSSVGQFLNACVGIFASLVPVVLSQPLTLALLFPAAVLYVGLFKAVRGAQLRLNAISQVVRSPWMSLTAETLPGLTVVRSLQAESRFMDRYRKLINRHISTGFYVVAVNLWFAFRLEILGVALVGGFILAMTLSPFQTSTMLAAVGLTFSLQMVGILGGVARSLRMLENALIAVDRVSEYTHLSPEQGEVKYVPSEDWPSRGEIRLVNLMAAYDASLPPVITGIKLTIPSACKVGVVGRTGSGKSTLFLALTHMIPLQSGMIFIDNVDIAEIPIQRLRRSISMIPQDPVLFSGTLRENLDPFSQHSDSAIETALRRAHLESLCATAERAAQFKIEENGRNLSVGERQLVCLARALLNKCKILLIDEATANVDVATDAKIQQTLREEFTDCTRLIIAHRTNTLSDVDMMVRLDRGQLVDA